MDFFIIYWIDYKEVNDVNNKISLISKKLLLCRSFHPLSYKFCERNHAKVFIIDDKLAYVGSANVTRAGLRQDTSSQQNFEAGILTEDPDLVSSIKAFFSEIWNSKWCECTIEDNCDEK